MNESSDEIRMTVLQIVIMYSNTVALVLHISLRWYGEYDTRIQRRHMFTLRETAVDGKHI